MRQGFLAATLAGVAFLSLGAEAQAGDVTCAWKATPEMTKAALVREFADRGGKTIEELGLDNDSVGRLAKKCYAGKDPAQVKKALMGMAMEVAAGDILLNTYGVLHSTLDRAWNRLETEERDGLIGYASAIYDHSAPDPAARRALLAVVQDLGAPIDADFLQGEQFKQIQAYYMGRSLREAAERQF